jgi:hypothetical protein
MLSGSVRGGRRAQARAIPRSRPSASLMAARSLPASPIRSRSGRRCGVCQVCSGGGCVLADNVACGADGTGRCLLGVCNARPTCDQNGTECSTTCHTCCCSGECIGFPDGSCSQSTSGEPCDRNADCANNNCVGYVCAPSTCSPEADYCVDAVSTCGGFCFRPLGGGAARCGSPMPGCGCSRHQECVTSYGPGEFCVTVAPGSESCSCAAATPRTLCAVTR